MTKISWKPGTMLAPVPPVMVTCGTMEKPNVFTVAWTGIINSEPPMTYISVRPSRYSHDIIKESGEFVINLTTLELAKACDYCGVKSGKNTNKFEDMALEIEPCSQVKAPMLAKSPVTLECKVQSVTPMNTHDMFVAEIVNVNVDDKFVEEDGRLALEKAGLLAFVHGRYYTLGRDLGAFGFSVDKTKENKTKPRKSKFTELLKLEEKLKESTGKIKHQEPREEKKSEGRDRQERKNRRNDSEGFRSERRPRRNDSEGFGGERRPRRNDGEGFGGERRPRRNVGEGFGGERRPRRNDGEGFGGERRPRRNDGEGFGGERRSRRNDGEGFRRERSDNDEKRSFRKTSSRGEKSGGKPAFSRDGKAPYKQRRADK